MQSLHEVAQLTDKSINAAIAVHCDKPEWSAKDIQDAKDALYFDVIEGKHDWPSDDSAFLDMSVNIFNIMRDNEDDKEARAKDVMYEAIKSYCEWQLKINTDLYCGIYCESEY